MEITTIIKKLKTGDQDAFRELVFRYTGRLMSVAKIYTRNYEDAKDALQDGFLIIYQNIGSFNYEEETSFLAWMRKIVMNASLKKYRKKQFQMETYTLEFVEEPSIEPESFDKFDKEDLILEIHSLPLRYKQVVCLFAIEGYSHQEIGEMLGIESSSSRSTYSRAKVLLQKKLNPRTKVVSQKLFEKNKIEMNSAK
ncbi:MAG: sigma-70 family RNA polymerase sigma factor [Bacteroidota bacterium]